MRGAPAPVIPTAERAPARTEPRLPVRVVCAARDYRLENLVRTP
jgi:hypothetical protein